MPYDLLLKNGLIVDGSGLPAFRGDVGITGGRIEGVGKLQGPAARTIAVDGLVIAPGFIDHHTHLDAHLFWDPTGSSEPQHGVTTVVIGNCGLSLAPLVPGGEEAILKSFVRVEAMPRPALEQGLRWRWRSYGEYLDALEGRVAINVGGLAGHIALRHAVMGEEAVQRAATAAERRAIQGQLAGALRGGALGFSTNRNERHFREDGLPVASRLADDAELAALGDVCGELNSGVIESIFGRSKLEHLDWYEQLARRTQRPVIWQSLLHRWADPDLWRQQLERVAPIFAAGYRAYALTNTTPAESRFTLNNTQNFDEFPLWKATMFLPEEQRRAALGDHSYRERLRRDLAAPATTAFHRRWDMVRVVATVKPENRRFEGGSVAAVARERGCDPLDAFFDLALEEGLGTTYASSNATGDPEAVKQILRSPHVLVGLSDAGAHVEFTANFGYATTLLGLWVREHQALSLEAAVHKLTFQVASVYGIEGRGLLRPGYAGDVTVFDPATVGAGEAEWANDYPAGTRRLVQQSRGIHHTIVNGQVLYEEGRLTGALAGQVIRGSAYRGA